MKSCLLLMLPAVVLLHACNPRNETRNSSTPKQPTSMQLVALAQPVQDLQAPRDLFFDEENAPALSPEDRLRIMELDARFNLAVDTRNFDLLEGMFTEDGILDHQWGYRQGSRQIAELIRSHEPAEKNVRHQNTNHVLKRHADGRVTMYSYLMAVRVGENEPVGAPYLVAHGLNIHHLRKLGGQWKIEKLVLEQTWVNPNDLADAQMREQVAATAQARAAAGGR